MFLVKRELLYVFLFGFVVWFFGVVFVDRFNVKSVRNVMDKIVKMMCDKKVIGDCIDRKSG